MTQEDGKGLADEIARLFIPPTYRNRMELGDWLEANCNRVISALRSPSIGGVGEWKSIETAPKDGAAILLCNGRWMTVGHWHRATRQWASNGPVYSSYSVDEQPTHWMPLPPPPSAQIKE